MKKLVLLAAIAAASMSAQAYDVFIIGECNSWTLGDANYKMTDKGDGIFEWEGETLKSGFKFNDGTWDNNVFEGTEVVANIGSNGDPIELDTPYYATADGASGNIGFEGFTEVKNAKVVLDMNELTVTITGSAAGEPGWFLCGDFNNWANGDEAARLTAVEGKENVFEIKGVKFTLPVDENDAPKAEGTYKVAWTGWSIEYGAYAAPAEGEEAAGVTETLSASNLTANLVQGGNNAPYTVEGTFDVEVTITPSEEELVPGTCVIILTAAGSDAVEGIEAENAPVYYYNMQGVRVDNPTNGIYVKVVGEKAAKVLFNN
ncbi:MAG: hypothetical protein HDS23_04705 [Bacteroides sp.]|nr:hypothetical protein [Bacteroides sp.]MBD5338474.1 hypothetical protein [Bacteroides sp.]